MWQRGGLSYDSQASFPFCLMVAPPHASRFWEGFLNPRLGAYLFVSFFYRWVETVTRGKTRHVTSPLLPHGAVAETLQLAQKPQTFTLMLSPELLKPLTGGTRLWRGARQGTSWSQHAMQNLC